MSDDLVSVEMSHPMCIMRTKDIKHLYDRIEELEAENHLLKNSGIVEVAVRNPNVMEYMRHWEGRAEAAEAKLAKVVEALEKLNVGEGWAAQIARTTLAELIGGKDE